MRADREWWCPLKQCLLMKRSTDSTRCSRKRDGRLNTSGSPCMSETTYRFPGGITHGAKAWRCPPINRPVEFLRFISARNIYRMCQSLWKSSKRKEVLRGKTLVSCDDPSVRGCTSNSGTHRRSLVPKAGDQPSAYREPVEKSGEECRWRKRP